MVFCELWPVIILGWGMMTGSYLKILIYKLSDYRVTVCRSSRLLLELLHGMLYSAAYLKYGISLEGFLNCLLFSALLILSIIDFKIYEIPVKINYFILFLGLLRVFSDSSNFSCYIAGFFAVSSFLLIFAILSKGKAIGGGDIKLMAASGLLLGLKKVILAFECGCILALGIHLIRMLFYKEGREIALGPYLSMGIVLTVLLGNA